MKKVTDVEGGQKTPTNNFLVIFYICLRERDENIFNPPLLLLLLLLHLVEYVEGMPTCLSRLAVPT
jgi:hypothetical protein